MKHQFKTTIAVATLALSSILSLGNGVQALPPVDNAVDNTNSSTPPLDNTVENKSSNPMPEAEPSEEANSGTQFTCVSQPDGNIATVGQRPGGEPIPLIIWTSASAKYFGGKYSAKNRCQIVTQKFTQAVAESGGSLQDVVLMTGKVNESTVICVISTNDTGCSGKNTLFTLKPENAKKADQILAQIMQISREGSSAGVIRETSGRIQIRLSDVLTGKPNTPLRKPARKSPTRRNSGGL